MQLSQERKRRRKHRAAPVTKTVSKSIFETEYVKHGVWGLALILTLWTLFGSVQSSRAHYYFQIAKNGLAAFSVGDFLQQQAIITAAKAAIEIDPARANYHETLGSLYEYLALNVIAEKHKDKDTIMVQRQWLDLAYSHYLRAEDLRPYWPVTHANLGMIRWRQNTIDEQLFTHITNAHRLGRMKAEVHEFIVQIGGALYLSQHPYFIEQQAMFAHHFSNGIRNHQSRKVVLGYIAAMNIKSDVCGWVKQDELSQKWLKCLKNE
jgi:hypothetical protein